MILRDPQRLIMGMPIKDFIFKSLKMLGLLLFIFYYTYPQALGIMGRSFIVPSAALGLLLYAWNKFPFIEVPKVIGFFILFLFWCYFCEYMGNVQDEVFRMSYMRSQMAWFFTAYLVNFVLYNIHKNPKFEVIVGYIIGAIALQCIITFIMSQDEAANEFFYSLQLTDGTDFSLEVKEEIEKHRLMGYGTALFGAGMVAGYALILLVYIISKIKLNLIQFISLATTYCFIFFIGLFSARTTVIGLGASVGFLFVLYFIDKNSDKKQPIKFIWVSILLLSFGAGLATSYFPDYTDWAFELFDNFKETGKFSTDSSDALYHLFLPPTTIRSMFFGGGSMAFVGNDMGYTRILHYIGYPGAILFFGYQLYVASFSVTKDLGASLLALMIVAYSLVMNIKGFTDLNPVLYLFFFFFMFHKYYRYYPTLYKNRMMELQQKKLEQKMLEAKREQ